MSLSSTKCVPTFRVHLVHTCSKAGCVHRSVRHFAISPLGHHRILPTLSNFNSALDLISFNEILKAYIFTTSKETETQWIPNRAERNQEGIKTKSGLALCGNTHKKIVTIATNCSHYWVHSPHQYCDSYRGASGPATAIPIIFLMAVITHHRGNQSRLQLF